MQPRLPIDLHARWNGTKARRDVMCSSIVGPFDCFSARAIDCGSEQVGQSESHIALLTANRSVLTSSLAHECPF